MTILLSDPRVAAVPVLDADEPLVALGAHLGPARARFRSGLAARLDRARGAAYGAASGALAGAALFWLLSSLDPFGPRQESSDQLAVSLVIGAPAGALLGAAAGGLFGFERWDPVPLRR